MTVFNKTVT